MKNDFYEQSNTDFDKFLKARVAKANSRLRRIYESKAQMPEPVKLYLEAEGRKYFSFKKLANVDLGISGEEEYAIKKLLDYEPSTVKGYNEYLDRKAETIIKEQGLSLKNPRGFARFLNSKLYENLRGMYDSHKILNAIESSETAQLQIDGIVNQWNNLELSDEEAAKQIGLLWSI